VTGVRNGRVYSRRHAPRILGGSVTLPSGATLHDVRIDLQRRVGKHCFAFSGSHAAFVRARCGVARFFSVGNSLSFTYLLPAPLPRGRYVYAIRAIDNTGRASKLVGGVSDVAFRVK
jgi:hypothetical protein